MHYKIRHSVLHCIVRLHYDYSIQYCNSVINKSSHESVLCAASQGRLPVKWMAPETLFDRKYTTKSDVYVSSIFGSFATPTRLAHISSSILYYIALHCIAFHYRIALHSLHSTDWHSIAFGSVRFGSSFGAHRPTRLTRRGRN